MLMLFRYYGGMYVKGDIIVFIDDDCIVEFDWIVNGVKGF